MKKKSLPTTTRYALHTLLLAVLFALVGTQAAAAQGTGTKENPFQFENGASYTVTAGSSFYGVFTAPTDGMLSISNTNYAVYTDATFTTIDETQIPQWNGSYTDKAFMLTCKAGTTYCLGNNFMMSDVTFTFTFGQDTGGLELVEVSPEAGTTFNAGSGLVDITFNQSPTHSSISLTAGTATTAVSGNTIGAYLAIDAKEWINEQYNNGSLKEGDDIVFTIEGLAPARNPAALYNGTGTLVVAYKAGPKPLRLLTTANVPGGTYPAETFYSYYMDGDTTGVLKFVFSGEVNTSVGKAPTARLVYGNTESDDPGEMYTEVLNVTKTDANTLTVDLHGKLRRAQDMVTSGTDYGTIYLGLSGVRDTEGNYAYSEGSGSLGTFGFTFNFSDVNYLPETDWTVDDKSVSTINKDNKSVELWIREEGKKMAFSGVEIAYTKNGEATTATLNIDDISIETEKEERLIVIPLDGITPDVSTEVTFSLTGVERPDGLTDADAMTIFSHTYGFADNTQDGISTVSATTKGRKATVYSIDGKQRGRLGKGLRIVDGKKVIVK